MSADEPVEDREGQLCAKGRPHWPTADAVEPLVHLGQKTRDLAGVVLQIGIKRYDEFAAGRFEAGGKSRCLAKIATEADASDARISRRQLLDLLPLAVR